MKNFSFYLILFILSMTTGSCKKDNPNPTIPITYYYPPLTGSNWETISPKTLGWDEAKLNDLIKYVDENNSTAFIILYKGRIVTEKYFRGFNMNTSARIFSATKSMGAFLIGLAQEQGNIDINKKVTDYLRAGWSRASLLQENAITVKHLITMTSGLNEDLT